MTAVDAHGERPPGTAGGPAVSLADRLRGYRDALLMSPRFQRWAAAFPPTRFLARRRAGELFDICAGFVYSQVMVACVRLELFDMLRDGPLDVDTIAERTHLGVDSAGRLLDAAVALRLLDRRSRKRYGLGELGAAFLGNPGIAAMVEHHRMLYADLADPVALLRGETATQMSRYWPYAAAEAPEALDGDAVAAYSELMSASQPLVADDVLDAYSLASHKRLLDVGGGEGRFAEAAARRWPHLRIGLYDLPPVAERARRRLHLAGLGDRVEVHGGSFLTDTLPGGADVVSLVRIVHDHDDETALTLLRAAREAIAPGGVLLLAEPMADTPGARRVGDAYFGFYLHAMGSGRARSPDALFDLLSAAGFADAELRRTHRPILARVIVARV